MADPFARSTLTAGLYYRDPWAALEWMGKAFGFERSLVVTDKDGNLGHSEMRFGDGVIYVGSQWCDSVASPAVVGGKNTQTIHVQLKVGSCRITARGHARPAR